MTLRGKVLLIFGVIFISLFSAIYILSANQILNSFVELEKDNVIKNINRSLNALNNEILEVDAICYDWAAWDDTYEFIDNLNEEYIESNLVNSSFTALDINFMVYINISGNIVYAKAFDLENNTVIPIPEDLMTHIPYLSSFNETSSSNLGNLTKRGLIDLNGELTIVASRPILTSNDEGSIRGALIMGRFLNQQKIAELSEITGYKTSLLPYDESFNFLENTPIGVKPLSGDTVAGYALLRDIYGKPISVLKLEMPRDIYIHGVNTVRYFILTIAVVGIFFSTAAILFIDRSVLYRLSLLNATVSRIRESGNLKERVPINGNDELAELGVEINRMLEKIDSYYEKIRELNEQLRILNRILRHDILNNLTVVRVALEMIEPHDDSTRALIEHALKSVDKSVELVRSVREIESAIISETMLEPVSVREVAKRVAENYSEVAINIVGECICLADKALYSVIDNIVSNAIIHGGTDRIDIKIEDKGKWCEVRIVDYGNGIPDEIKDKIFDEGFRYGNTARTGLGLYIVKKVLERYNGDVTVEDNRPKGAVFVLRLRKPEGSEEAR